MSRISAAFSSFFSILFSGVLPESVASEFGYSKAKPVTAPAPEPPKVKLTDGALQILQTLQRDARLIDFLMEDMASYSDDQVGAAVRDVQQQSRAALERYMKLQPVIDGVEGDFAKTENLAPTSVKLVGNVPPSGKAPGGVLRHKGWKADKVDLPTLPPGNVLAPAEIEVE